MSLNNEQNKLQTHKGGLGRRTSSWVFVYQNPSRKEVMRRS